MSKILGEAAVKALEGRGINSETAARCEIHIDELRAKYLYEPETGFITFRAGPLRGRRAGTIKNGRGYRRILIGGRQVCSGPVCWALMTGEWSQQEIDHINRNKLDDRWANLREVSRSENLRNRCYAKSGAKGVYWGRGRWKAAAVENGKTVHIGHFPTIEQASAAYLEFRGGEL